MEVYTWNAVLQAKPVSTLWQTDNFTATWWWKGWILWPEIAKAEQAHQSKESICSTRSSRLAADWLKCCRVLAVCTEANRSRHQREMCSQEAYSVRRQRKGMLEASRYPSQNSIFPFVWEDKGNNSDWKITRAEKTKNVSLLRWQNTFHCHSQ